MPTYLIFNGDADGICAAKQIIDSESGEYSYVTGVKRDISLLKKIRDFEQNDIYVFDVAVEKNLTELKDLLSNKCCIKWFDHHVSPDIPADDNLETHIDTDPNVNTSFIVSRYLGKHDPWAVVGLFGDNMSSSAEEVAVKLKIEKQELHRLKELGELMNYNAYGETLDDLHVDPAELLRQITPYSDPLDFYIESSIVHQLKEGRASDLQMAENADRLAENIILFPNQKWAKRVVGIYANLLANQNPDRAHAVLVEKDNGNEYVVSVRSPLNSKKSAATFCQEFPTGGGRQKAAGINSLPETKMSEFVDRFNSFYG